MNLKFRNRGKSMILVDITNLWLKYKKEYILENFSLDIRDREILVLLGESGCGKSSLLKIILGILHPEKGKIVFQDRDISNLSPQKRNMGYVPQAQVLFPHMTVKENIMFGLKVHKEIEDPDSAYDQAIRLTRLEEFQKRYPSELSGGQQQRVALARAIAIHPQMLLLDEPLSSIDATGREELALTIRRIQQETGTTIIYVTHNHEEARLIGDRIAVIFDGKVQQLGMVSEVYQTPQNYQVANILGKENIWPIQIMQDQDIKPTIITPFGNMHYEKGTIIKKKTCLHLPCKSYNLVRIQGVLDNSEDSSSTLLKSFNLICRIDSIIPIEGFENKIILSIFPDFLNSLKIYNEKPDLETYENAVFYQLTIPWSDFELF